MCVIVHIISASATFLKKQRSWYGLFLQSQQVDALRTLNGKTQGAVPDQLHQWAQSTTHTEGHGVVQGLLETVVVEEHTRRGVHVGVRVLGLAVLRQHLGGDLGVLLDQLEDWVGQHIRTGVGKVHQGLEARVGLAENSVAVSGHDTARLEGFPQVGAHVLVSELGSDLVLHGQDPAQHFLRGQTVQWTSQA